MAARRRGAYRRPIAYVFGYGSLVVPAGPDGEGLLPVPAALRGHRRTWGVAMDNSRDIPGYKHYVDEETGERPPVCVAFLDLRETGDERDQVGGVVFAPDEVGLAALDERERNYRRVDVRAHLNAPVELDGPVWAYAGRAESRARVRTARTGRVVVARSYLEAVRAGFAAWGPDALTAFERSTDAPPGPVLDLRLVRHPPLAPG